MTFIDLLELNFSEHRYSLAATGVHFRGQEFGSRQAAEAVMYRFINKHNMDIQEVWDDKHYKTYICGQNVKFYINRI